MAKRHQRFFRLAPAEEFAKVADVVDEAHPRSMEDALRQRVVVGAHRGAERAMRGVMLRFEIDHRFIEVEERRANRMLHV